MSAADTYRQLFRCYPVSQLAASEEKRRASNFGGKIYLPSSALGKLTTLRISYPMLFQLRSPGGKLATHAGVLEFIAPEGRTYVPEWMMQTLSLQPGSLVELRSLSLALGTFVKLEPQTVEFLEISDPKAVLENSLRNFSALTVGDVFALEYNDHVYSIRVLEVRPDSATKSVCVVETDLEVDFAPPVGYVEPERDFAAKRKRVEPQAPFNTPGQSVYQEIVRDAQDAGATLSGRVPEPVPPVDASIYANRDAPSLVLPDGQLFFGFPVVPVGGVQQDAFGQGRSLKE